MEAVRVTVFQVDKRNGISKTTGNKWEMTIAQCMVDAHGQKLVGEMILPRDHPDVKPGDYDATFTVSIDRDKRITGQVATLTPVRASQVSPVKSA